MAKGFNKGPAMGDRVQIPGPTGDDEDARRHERLVRIERDRVLVHGDVNFIESLLGYLSSNSLSIHEHIHEKQVIIRTAGHEP